MMYGIMFHVASLKEGVPEFDVSVIRVPRDVKIADVDWEDALWGDIQVIDEAMTPDLSVTVAQAVAAMQKDIASLPHDDEDHLAGETRAGWPKPTS
jgi:hypothetical protein